MTNTQILRERFLIESYSHSEASIKKRSLFWKQVAAAEDNIGKHLEDGYTRDEFLKLFSELNVGQIGTMYVNKSIIAKYLKWLQGTGFDGELNTETLREIVFEDLEYGETVRESHFKDFDSLQKEIDNAVKNADKIDDTVHDVAVSIIYLAWYGITIEEASEIRKEDINQIGCTIYIRSTNRTVSVSQKVIDFLVEYRDSKGYATLAKAGEIKMPYKESNLLLRTARLPNLNVVGIKNLLSRFSKYRLGNGKLSYSKIRLSGIFSRVNANEMINGTLVKNDYDKLAEVFGETYKSYHDASDRLREYKSWKSMFYPND